MHNIWNNCSLDMTDLVLFAISDSLFLVVECTDHIAFGHILANLGTNQFDHTVSGRTQHVFHFHGNNYGDRCARCHLVANLNQHFITNARHR